MTMAIDIVKRSNMAILRISEDISLQSADALHKALDGEITDGIKNIIVDLSDVEFISCKGIGVLAQAAKKIRQGQGDLKLIIPDRRVGVLFEILGLASVLEIFPDEEAAAGSFSSKAVGTVEKKLLWRLDT